MYNTPVLLLIFNRPDKTEIVFESIKAVQPKYLFVAADGPRKDKVGEEKLCLQARDVINKIDWPCELKTLYRTENLGCGVAPYKAITWFFEHVEQGIILEDDCVANTSFFSFCENLLDYYKDNQSIMHIGGTNSQFGKKRGVGSYYFSIYPHIWGWATWRRAWQKFQFSFSEEQTQSLSKVYEHYNMTDDEKAYWTHHYNVIQNDNRTDIWDMQWTFSCWFNKGVSIVPNANLISNIGFDETATHTNMSTSKLSNIPTIEIKKIIHPGVIKIDRAADLFTFKKYNMLELFLTQKIRNWMTAKMPKAVKEKIKSILK